MGRTSCRCGATAPEHRGEFFGATTDRGTAPETPGHPRAALELELAFKRKEAHWRLPETARDRRTPLENSLVFWNPSVTPLIGFGHEFLTGLLEERFFRRILAPKVC
ncbi:hypothetical protein AV530_017577 [Patagioenas fasciata monilis]|uniref:Uncharacterized protein n=1 Tax=Patagioenas fasciata monilis TaxID=372326 RepID=A0A1V4JIF7_PATFA|nr:hypothetical protein AV530_017577 [Patagioenas fasciata monilis]